MSSSSGDWTLWQMLDSVFPSGGFAHSYGLEAAAQLGVAPDLASFIKSTLENSGALLLPFVHASHKLGNNIQDWIELDTLLNAHLSNHVARRSSMSQGRGLLRTAAGVFPELPQLGALRQRLQLQERNKVLASDDSLAPVFVHHATVFGVIFGMLGFDGMTTQRAYLFVTMRDLLSAATRLNLVGPLQGAAMQRSLSGAAESVLERCANRPVGDAHQVTPLLDAAQACHDQLFSRLFCS